MRCNVYVKRIIEIVLLRFDISLYSIINRIIKI